MYTLLFIILVLVVLVGIPSYETRQKMRLIEHIRASAVEDGVRQIDEYLKRNNITTAEQFKACVERDLAAQGVWEEKQ